MTREQRCEPKGAEPQNLILFSPQPRFMEAAAKKWIDYWGDGDALPMDGSETSPGRLHTALNSFPLLQERNVVRLYHAESCSRELLDTLERYLSQPSESTALLIEYEGDPAKASASWKSILNKVSKRSCSPGSVPDYLEARAKAEGYKIAPNAVQALQEWSGGDMAKVPAAVDMLFLYRAREKEIGEKDASALLGAGGTPRIWDLQDAFLAKKRAGFLKLLEQTRADPDFHPLAFSGMLARQFRLLLKVRSLLSAGLSPARIKPDDIQPKLHRFVAKKLLGFVGKWTEAELREGLDALYRLDLALKGDPGTPDALLERHLLALFQHSP
jgi:DNA polymerase III delta subunit